MVDKDAMFDELAKNFPAANYTTFCNKMGVGYNEAKSMLTRCKEDYNVALRDLLAQWDQREKGVTQRQLEDALDKAEVGALCAIVRKHYAIAATRAGGGDGAVLENRNQSINQSAASNSEHTTRRASHNTSAAAMEDDSRVVGGEQIRQQAGQAALMRQRVSQNTSAAPAEDADDDDDDDVVYDGGDTARNQAQVSAVRRRGETNGTRERQVQEQGVLRKTSLETVDTIGEGRRRGSDPTSIRLERTTETRDGDKSTTILTWTGVSKEHITLLGIVLIVGAGLFLLNRHKK